MLDTQLPHPMNLWRLGEHAARPHQMPGGELWEIPFGFVP